MLVHRIALVSLHRIQHQQGMFASAKLGQHSRSGCARQGRKKADRRYSGVRENKVNEEEEVGPGSNTFARFFPIPGQSELLGFVGCPAILCLWTYFLSACELP